MAAFLANQKKFATRATSGTQPGLLFHKAAGKNPEPEERKEKLMKSRLITLSAACVALFATVSMGLAQDPAQNDGPRHRWRQKRGNPVERLTKALELTPDQQAKVAAIFEQAKPQIKAAREEGRQKAQAIRENIRSQIRPILTPAQQQKYDAIKKAREDMRKAREEMRDALKSQ